MERRIRSEKGFTLIELLVVILIIGILAAIALPAFLGQRSKGQDASAKSDARNMVSHVETCFTGTETYASCTNPTQTNLAISTTFPPPVGSVSAQAGPTIFTIVAHSRSGNYFSITHATDGSTARTCTSAGDGSCPDDTTW